MTIKLEGQSFPIDRDSAVAAIAARRTLLDRLPDYPRPEDIARGLPDTTGELAENAIDDYDDGDGAINFAQALLIASSLAEHCAPSTHEGDLVVETDDAQAAVHYGSLTVKGKLELDANLIVLGDLRVEGRIQELVNWTRLIVTGDLESSTMWTGSPVWVGGRGKAEVIYLGHHGMAFFGGGVGARLVIESPESRGLNGQVQAEHHIKREEWMKGGQPALARLSDVLVDDAVKVVNGTFFDPTELFALAESGAPYLRGAL